ncbi:hypothetical protein AAF712_002406 [Marasmius tenuissimus]|uniref:Uncharacterized protein n=1 Tax=Marasmius tenuissimus TaxID=585030 RepID=A0ABR3AB19_9AGAR
MASPSTVNKKRKPPPNFVSSSDWQDIAYTSRQLADEALGVDTIQKFTDCDHLKNRQHYFEISMGLTIQAWGLFRLSSHPNRALEKCSRCAKHESAQSNEYMLTVKRIYLDLIKHKTGGQAEKHRADIERWYPDPEPDSSSGIQLPTPPSTSPASSQGMSIANSRRTGALIDLTLSPDASSARKRKAPTRSGSPIPKGKGKEKQRRIDDSEPLAGREDDYIAVTVALTEELIESPGEISRNLEEVLIDLRYQLLTCKRF